MDSINKLPANLAQKPQTEINKAQSKIQSVENSTTGKVDEKLSILSKQADGQGNLPGGVNLPKTDLGINKIVPGDLKMSNLKIDQTIPSINKPAIPGNVLDKKLGDDVSLPKGLGTSTPKELNGSTKFSETDKLLKSTGELSKASGKVAGYTGDIKNIEGGNLEKVKTLKEEAISNTPVNAELAEIQKQDRIIKDQQAKLQSYKNPEAYKKQVLARSKQMVALQMVTFEKQLQQTITQVSKYQGKLGTVLSETSAMSKKRDKLKRLRTYEKYVPGVTFQVLKPAELIIDVNPFLRYRLTSYWSIGLGWNERVLFGKSAQTYDHNRIYGVRAFTEVIIFKGVSFRLDAERMSTSVAIRPQTQDVGKRVDVWSYMAGIKKEFSFIPKIHGNVQFMYKIYASNIDDPYPTRCNVRFGFEYMANKRLKK